MGFASNSVFIGLSGITSVFINRRYAKNQRSDIADFTFSHEYSRIIVTIPIFPVLGRPGMVSHNNPYPTVPAFLVT